MRHAHCSKCGEDIGDDRAILVGSTYWHEGCALSHVIASMASLTAPAETLLDAAQVGSRLGVSASTVHRLAREGAIGFIPMTRPGADDVAVSRKFRQAHVDAFIATRERLASPEATEAAVRPRTRPQRVLTARELQHPSLAPRSHRDRTAPR